MKTLNSKTKVAVIGLGKIGEAIARNFTKGGYSVILASRDIEKAKALANKLGDLAIVKEITDAIQNADVVIPAIYFNALKEFFQTYSQELDGKIIVDVSNPIAPDGNGGFKKIIGEHESAGKILSELIPKKAKLIKAFGTLGAGSLLKAAFNDPEKKVLFYASDNTNSNQQIEELIIGSGFVPFHIGGLEQSIRIEVFGDLHEFGELGKTVTLEEAKNKVAYSKTIKMKKTIVVIGATGLQGKGVVNALVNQGTYNVRAVTRNPEKYSGKAHEAVKGDLKDVHSIKDAFKNAHGVFVVTNFWEDADEIGQGKNAIEAAKETGIQHFIWSTLPNVETISKGEFEVPHFTGKAKIDELVKSAGFKYYTFVQPPFYYQNFIGMLSPQPKEDGSTGWTLPIDPTKKVIHMSDINDLGAVVAGAFSQPEKVGNGNYLALATELNSFNDILQAYKANAIEYSFTQVPAEVFSTFFEGAKELAKMFGYFEKHTYMGTDSETKIGSAKNIATNKFASLNEWIKQNN